MLNYTESKLSPSQQAILDCFYRHGCKVFSWQLNQECHTVAYSQRIGQLKKMGYTINKFIETSRLNSGHAVVRHGYTLVPPSTKVNP